MSAISGLESWRPERFGERPLWCRCGHHVVAHHRACDRCKCEQYVRDFVLPSAWFAVDVSGLGS